MAKRIFIQGVELEVPVSQSEGSVEYVFTDVMEFHGITLFFENPIFGDELELNLLAPDNTVAFNYSSNCKLTSKTNQIEIKVESKDEAAEVPVGFKIRLTYLAVDSLGRKITAWLRLKK